MASSRPTTSVSPIQRRGALGGEVKGFFKKHLRRAWSSRLLIIVVPLALVSVVTAVSFRWAFDKPAGVSSTHPGASAGANDAELVKRIREVAVHAQDRHSRDDVIQTLLDGINELCLGGSAADSLGVLQACSGLYLMLSYNYESGSDYKLALSANEHEFSGLQRIYNKDPFWMMNKDFNLGPAGHVVKLVSVAEAISNNRLKWTSLVHAVRNTTLSPDERQKVREAIRYAGESLRNSRIIGKPAADIWMDYAVAYWLNGDLDLAESAMKEAADIEGAAALPAAETMERKTFYGWYYVLLAAIQAEAAPPKMRGIPLIKPRRTI